METLCKIRDIYRAIAEFERRFEKKYRLCLNEGMLLCSISKEVMLSSGQIAMLLELTASNASKVIKSVEEKGLVERVIGKEDKRQMYFSLTPKGKELLSSITCNTVKVPDLLQPLIR
ncbi:MAG: winged helix DNA-binding protein [Bacteroidales bacterium]|nr:winged helix DNA-binding protein [Bacteroidales bacterium]